LRFVIATLTSLFARARRTRALRLFAVRVLALVPLALALLGLSASRVAAELGSPAAASRAATSSVLRRPALHWTRADDALGCVDPRALAEHVEALVGPVLVRASEAENSIEGRVDRLDTGKLRVRVRVLDVTGAKVGERTFEQAAEDCADLTPAIVFVIAMVIDPDVAAHGLPPALVALIAGGERPPEQVLLDELDKGPTLAARTTPVQASDDELAPQQPMPDRMQASSLLRASYGEAMRAVLSLDLRFLYTLPRHLAVLGYVRGGVQLGTHELAQGRALNIGTFDAGIALCAGHTPERDLRLTGCLGVNDLDIATAPAGVAQLTLRWRLHGGVGLAAMIDGRVALVERDIGYGDSDNHTVHLATLGKFSGGVAVGPTFEF
jgi:hypothetical protein